MPTNRNLLSPDWQAIFINRVRSTGVWCDASEHDKLRHYFVCRNEKATVAISRCGQIIKPFEKLHENAVKQKCLVCDLYEQAGKEVQAINERRLEQVLESQTQTQTRTQE